jgi:diaminopimelate epimerase
MEIDFLKMQGCAEDVVLLDSSRAGPIDDDVLPILARRALDRSFGVGGACLLTVGAATAEGLPVRCFDPDGDEVPPGSHAARCAARYAADSGIVSSNDFLLLGAEGRQRAQIIDSANVRLDMGLPFSGERAAEIKESAAGSFTRTLLVEGRSLTYTPVSLDRPYGIFFVPDFSFPTRRTARAIAAQEDFPDGMGIGFVQVCSREEMRLRMWVAADDPPGDEGDCACASLVAAVVNGFSDREPFVHLRGGDVLLQWEERDNRIWLTGPAGYVFTGTYDLSERERTDTGGRIH